ncbi:PREDICTED: glycoprotein-N-acetylgalactosamine 3-beta-galactosyltransferase 1 [Rhagoletis zephyria]|uniref:glycoprotein-N-acetylgalactosamine 3-beta-galactosyltransferase 1 n=1 Tax=Rhagoletis zephyria TaxID=28612 RepID=UPI0008116CDD|nr:PREDICTED: glycoprotein-N-acetylgalactosamine 3-beta-galactosyltransferase 1 [Rhagoletis zephyria]XP_036322557.1 glycoprotein-N-acetylgalactosamine 3-beta-galactosyltransferase 1 [Rhagoletis pomonella]
MKSNLLPPHAVYVRSTGSTLRMQLHILFGFVLGFLMALCTLLLYNCYQIETVTHRQQITATEYWQTGYMMAMQDVATEAETLQPLNTKVRVLCMVLTSPDQHASHARHVKATWGKRCTRLIFLSSQVDEKLGAVSVVEREADTYDDLWNKTREGFRYVYERYYDDYDWFVKADDDTYMVMENLRYMLYAYYPQTPIYFGYQLIRYGVPYMSGGAAYVLSKEALRRFMTMAFHNTTLCPRARKFGIEDFNMGICLQNVGVHLADARFALGTDNKPKFIPIDLHTYMSTDNTTEISDWLLSMSPHRVESGLNCCSNYSIAFHYTNPWGMYLYEYLIYHLRAFGVSHHTRSLPAKLPLEEVIRLFPSNYSADDKPVVDLGARNLADEM